MKDLYVKGFRVFSPSDRQKEFMLGRAVVNYKDIKKWMEMSEHLLDDRGDFHIDLMKSKDDREKIYVKASDYYANGKSKTVSAKEHSPDRDLEFLG